MATSRLDSVFQQLRRAVLMQDGAGLTDAQLLELFITQHDHAAFEALVRRYGPMVMKVCYRVIRDHHDAEDAYQATFLLLARKASSVKTRERVANWLHGVAFRTALQARSLRAKTQVRERQVATMPEPEAVPQDAWHDLQPLLDQELSRLAEIYRLPILLCDLEGKSIKKTAQQLGWPQGTVAGRLARGRKLLAKRLARHGLAMAGGVVLLQNSVSACVPPALVAATVKAAGAYAAGKAAATGLISANVALLMEGMVKAMFFTKVKIAMAVLMVGSIVALGGGVLINGTAGGQQIEAGKGDGKAGARQVDQPKEKTDARANDAPIAQTDHEKLRGTWRVVKMHSYGINEYARQDSFWWIGKNEMVMNSSRFLPRSTLEGRQDARYQLWGDNDDTAPAPNNINITIRLADSQLTYRGIFELKGDSLKLCFRGIGFGKRPTEIPASPNSKDDHLLVVILERQTAAPKTDEEKIQGDWKMVRGEQDGEQIGIPSTGPIPMSFVGDLMIDPEDGSSNVFKLDSTTKPKQITIINKSRNVERKMVGIYLLDDDTLKLCYSQDDKDPVPSDFTATQGSGRHLFILNRVKAAGEGATSSQLQGRNDRKDQRDVNNDQPQPPANNPKVVNELVDVLKNLELEKPHPKMARPLPPPVPVPTRYQFQFDVFEVGENGEKRIGSPILSNREGDQCVFFVGEDVVMQSRKTLPGVEVQTRPANSIPLAGIGCTVSVSKMNDGKLRLDLQAEKLEPKGDEKNELRVQGTSLRTIKIIKLGEKTTIDLDGNEKKGPRTRIELKVLSITPPPGMQAMPQSMPKK